MDHVRRLTADDPGYRWVRGGRGPFDRESLLGADPAGEVIGRGKNPDLDRP